MRIAFGCDHRGQDVKQRLIDICRQLGHEVEDVQVEDCDPCDYPDVAAAVARRVARGEAERAVLVCGTGIGMAIAANKVRGIRAAAVHSAEEARLSRGHNDLNVLCLSGDLFAPDDYGQVLSTWLNTAFEGGRHERRVAKIAALESAEAP